MTLFNLEADSTPKVLNMHARNIPDDAVYIGRGSKWGNPFIIGQFGDRKAVIEAYEEWLQDQPELMAEARLELQGKHLVCYCKPAACHGDVLLKVANSL